MYRDFLAITIKNHEIRTSLKDLFNFSRRKISFFRNSLFFLNLLKELYMILFTEFYIKREDRM